MMDVNASMLRYIGKGKAIRNVRFAKGKPYCVRMVDFMGSGCFKVRVSEPGKPLPFAELSYVNLNAFLNEWEQEHQPPVKQPVKKVKVCQCCGAEYVKSGSNQKYCSDKCNPKTEWNRTSVSAEAIAADIERWSSRLSHKQIANALGVSEGLVRKLLYGQKIVHRGTFQAYESNRERVEALYHNEAACEQEVER